LTGSIKIWMSAHALAMLQIDTLSSSAQLTGRQSCSRGDSELALLIRSTERSCGATAILYSVVPRLGGASPQRFFLRPAPQVLMSLPWQLGALAATSAMAGDCLSSFVKRQSRVWDEFSSLHLPNEPRLAHGALCPRRATSSRPRPKPALRGLRSRAGFYPRDRPRSAGQNTRADALLSRLPTRVSISSAFPVGSGKECSMSDEAPGRCHVWMSPADQGLFSALRWSWMRSCLRPCARRI
jgi:hypothetical protein